MSSNQIPASDIDQKLASQAVIKPHSELKIFASHPDTIPSHARGMALIDKIDELIAEDDFQKTKTNAAQIQLNLVKERINQRRSAVPHYNGYLAEIENMVAQLTTAVETHQVSESENIPFYRLLKEEIMKKPS